MKICGIDEAGRGPLAGPVTAAAVVFTGSIDPKLLADSKTLSPLRREEARTTIVVSSFWALGWADSCEIDRVNILQASLLAMSRAWINISALLQKGDADESTAIDPSILTALVDGNRCPDLSIPCEAIVKGDSKIPEIQAASILAKTARDRWIESYASIEPRYGFETHKGYPTALHKARLNEFGPSPIHRRSFRGVSPE